MYEKTQVRNGVYVPEDPELRRMFIQAKKYAAIDKVKEDSVEYFTEKYQDNEELEKIINFPYTAINQSLK